MPLGGFKNRIRKCRLIRPSESTNPQWVCLARTDSTTHWPLARLTAHLPSLGTRQLGNSFSSFELGAPLELELETGAASCESWLLGWDLATDRRPHHAPRAGSRRPEPGGGCRETGGGGWPRARGSHNPTPPPPPPPARPPGREKLVVMCFYCPLIAPTSY
jgi:hypothetical protein